MISLAETAILLAAAVVAVSLFRFARLSSILGYLAAGLVIGPWGLNLIGNIDRIVQVSEFGIVLLLFIIGLELQPTRLWVMRRLVGGTAEAAGGDRGGHRRRAAVVAAGAARRGARAGG